MSASAKGSDCKDATTRLQLTGRVWSEVEKLAKPIRDKNHFTHGFVITGIRGTARRAGLNAAGLNLFKASARACHGRRPSRNLIGLLREAAMADDALIASVSGRMASVLRDLREDLLEVHNALLPPADTDVAENLLAQARARLNAAIQANEQIVAATSSALDQGQAA
jgi:hypothetical protein